MGCNVEKYAIIFPKFREDLGNYRDVARGKLTIECINERLKVAKVGVSVRQKGNRLYLRATLPPKPGSLKVRPYQQDVALKIYANPAGLERAESEACKLGASLACKEFRWDVYLLPEEGLVQLPTVGQWIDQFRVHYVATHRLSDRTWRNHWAMIYKRLPQDAVLDADLLLEQVLKTSLDTRDRKQTCHKLQKLAEFAGIEVELKPYSGGYSSSKTKRRDLPDDKTIVEWRDRIPNPCWQWLY